MAATIAVRLAISIQTRSGRPNTVPPIGQTMTIDAATAAPLH